MKRLQFFFLQVLVLLATATMGTSGAIFTTDPAGNWVNENKYETKSDVYLDGGPGANSPQTAAGLNDGWYVFQVTDPSGKNLLSMDPSKCRVFEVEDGVITRFVPPSVFGLSNTYTVGSKTYPCHIQDSPDGVAGPSGRHDTNTDMDYGPPAIVVQLMPFGDTSNPGGVYKAWVEKFDTYQAKGGDLSLVPVAIKGAGAKSCPSFCAKRDPGFGPAKTDTKTDNFRVKTAAKAPVPPEITVLKFHDRNANGVFDNDDEWVTGWQVQVTDPLDVTNSAYTPATIVAEPPGDWSFDEENPAGAQQTASYVDGIQTNPFPTDPAKVTVAGSSGEKHEVVYGNVGLGEVTACKIWDYNENGVIDEGEPFITGWKMKLEGTVANGEAYGPVEQFTGENGCTTYSGLLPGNYTITEIGASDLIPPYANWAATGPTSYNFTIVSTRNGNVISAGSFQFTFFNYCENCLANLGTKAYRHAKTGLDKLYADPDVPALPTCATRLHPNNYSNGCFRQWRGVTARLR